MNKPVCAPFFHYTNGQLHVEHIALNTLADQYGTPLYVYSKAALQHAWQQWQAAIGDRPVMVCYGMKANSNLAILQLFAQWGAGFDIVSGGELQRCLKAGANPQKIVFSGVGKQDWEIRAAIEAGICSFNVESLAELHHIAQIAHQMGQTANISLRVNPDVDAQTHPYISTGLKENKFGIDMAQIEQAKAFIQANPSLKLVGLDCHIGSQITEISPFLDALDKLCQIVQNWHQQGIILHHLDLGGGVGIQYDQEQPLSLKSYIDAVFERLTQYQLTHLNILFEPGRSLVGNAGVLLTTVQYLKNTQEHQFAVVDAAMTDLARPALYQAYHHVLTVTEQPAHAIQTYDIVGPVCESGDWLAKARQLALAQGERVVIESAGAYGFTMSSQYNTRPRCAEILVDGSQAHVIRRRETVEDIYALDCLLPVHSL